MVADGGFWLNFPNGYGLLHACLYSVTSFRARQLAGCRDRQIRGTYPEEDALSSLVLRALDLEQSLAQSK
jgi:hypothetical protein